MACLWNDWISWSSLVGVAIGCGCIVGAGHSLQSHLRNSAIHCLLRLPLLPFVDVVLMESHEPGDGTLDFDNRAAVGDSGGNGVAVYRFGSIGMGGGASVVVDVGVV